MIKYVQAFIEDFVDETLLSACGIGHLTGDVVSTCIQMSKE